MQRQTTVEMEQDLSDDITIARDLIQSKVDSTAGSHFCLPFSTGSNVARRLLKAKGIQSCTWGAIPGKQYNRPGQDPLMLCRLKADFLRRLPGQGRSSLLDIYAGKSMRRLRGAPVY
jgi:hypothetical protein